MGSASSPPQLMGGHEEGHFDGEQGRRIYHQAWIPEGELRGVVVVAHGAAEHGARYGHLVERLAPEGFAVHAVDHRGHGRSEGGRAQIDRMAAVVADLDRVVDHAAQRHPGKLLFLLGHSMGGLIALLYAGRHEEKLTGLALSAPLAKIEAAPLPLRLLARTLSTVAPGAGVLQLDGSKVSRDPEEVAAYDADPLNYRGKLPARTVQELVNGVAALPDAVARITLPLLIMQGSADELVPPEGARMVYDRAASTDKTLETYDGYYHELFNEPAGERDRPLDDVAAWLLAHS